MIVFLIISILCVSTRQEHNKGFDDTVLFNIEWPGNFVPDESQAVDAIEIVSSHQERYKCFLPTISESDSNLEETYDGPSALELIAPLFAQTTCSFRLELYWTYEVCHGRFIRQYHEDREGKTVKVQEYILGKWDDNYFESLLTKQKDVDNTDKPVPVKKIDNVNLPYYEVIMDNGTVCAIQPHKPRITKVLYVCYVHGKHEIYSLKETVTCVYEIIILSPLLCSHPKFKPKDSGEHQINCIPLGGSYKKPYSMAKLQHDSAMIRRNSDLDRYRVELIKVEKDDPPMISDPKLVDPSPIISFLKGENCLRGGTGWWKFEFCYGKSVEQYHIDKDGKKISINLGIFNKDTHLEWMRNNPMKRPKPVDQRKHLSHFYSSGSVCDKTGKPRQTEVKLKCLKNPPSPNAVSLYLLEPKFCHYLLGVESPLICDILPKADGNGLVDVDSYSLNINEHHSNAHIEV